MRRNEVDLAEALDTMCPRTFSESSLRKESSNRGALTARSIFYVSKSRSSSTERSRKFDQRSSPVKSKSPEAGKGKLVK